MSAVEKLTRTPEALRRLLAELDPPRRLTFEAMPLGVLLDTLEAAGVAALAFDPEGRSIRWRAPQGAVTPKLQRHLLHYKLHLLAHVQAAAVLPLADVRRLVGIIPRDGYRAGTDAGRRREALYAALEGTGETLTLEELETRVAQQEV